MHLIPRYYHGTRFDIENGLPGCARVHYHYTIRKEEWGAFMLEHWGPDKFREMWAKAMKITKPDYAEILASLRSDPEPKPERVVFEEAS